MFKKYRTTHEEQKYQHRNEVVLESCLQELEKWTGTKGGHTSVKHSHGKLFDKISLKTAPLKMCNQSGPQTTDVTMDASRLCCYNYELSLFK